MAVMATSEQGESPTGPLQAASSAATESPLPAAPPSPTLRPAITVGWLQRAALLAVGMCTGGLLLTASQLTPRSDGLGTHQQLGLPPCTVRVLWGTRCPACGMTTSWAYFTQGQFVASAATNAGGFALALIATAAAPITALLAITGQTARRWMLPTLVVALTLAVAISMTEWLLRLWG